MTRKDRQLAALRILARAALRAQKENPPVLKALRA